MIATGQSIEMAIYDTDLKLNRIAPSRIARNALPFAKPEVLAFLRTGIESENEKAAVNRLLLR
jgi:hypothetical protein